MTKQFRRKKDAELFLDAIRGDLAHGRYVDPPCNRIALPNRENGEVVPLTAAQVQQMADACPGQQRKSKGKRPGE